MVARLTEAEKEQFAAMRERLSDVDREDPDDDREPPTLGPLEPMLAQAFEGTLDQLDPDEWVAEPKYDGTRLLLQRFDGEVRAYSRRGVERSESVPNVIREASTALPTGCVLDGEYAFVDDAGRTEFVPIHTNRERIVNRGLEGTYYVFDVLVHDGDWVTRSRLGERYDLLTELLTETEHVERTPVVETDFQSFYDEFVAVEEEGIMVKRRTSHYYPGIRSNHWRKVKAFTTADLLAVGYTPGEGSRAPTFGALVLSDGEQYRGRVGSGFTRADRERLLEAFEEVDDRPYLIADVGRSYTPIEPIVVTVRFQEITGHGDLRAPVFIAADPDRSPASVDALNG